MPLRFVTAALRLLAMTLLAVAGSAQDQLFSRADYELPLRPQGYDLGAAGRLVLRDGGLLLDDRPLACTMPGGTGTIHAIARERSGRIVAAADKGLFVLDARHPVLDAMDVRDGVPNGPFVDVEIHARGHIWFVTERELGVVDPAYGFGRTFDRSGGRPGATFQRLSFRGSNLFVQTDAGVYTYQAFRGRGPELASGRIVREQLTASVDGVAPFELDVQANGGAMLRQRVEHHHLLTPIADSQLANLKPGHLKVEVYAFDRDLRRAKVASYRVHVPLPPQFSTRYLPYFAAGGGLLLLLLSWPWHGRRRFFKALLRAGVLGVIGLQLLAATMGYGRSWPFMGFSMYTETYFESTVLYKPNVFGITADNRRRQLTDWDMGLTQDGYWHLLSEMVFGPPERFAEIAKVVKRRKRLDLIGIDIYDHRIRLTSDGPVDVAPTLVHRWRKP